MFSLSPLPPSLSVKNFFTQMCRPRAPFFLASPLDLLESYPFEGDRRRFKSQVKGFPGSSVIKNPRVNSETCIPSLVQEDPLASEQLSPCPETTESVLLSPRTSATEPSSHSSRRPHTLEPMLHNKRSHCNEKPTHYNLRVAPACCD